jgi:tripartite-type tricarboxylate transporter receptor subunit TctC
LPGGTNVNAIIGALYKNLGFDPIDSFAPIAAICTDSMALAIPPRVPAQSFQEFVDFAKNNPGKLRYGAPPGIYTHFAGEFFKVKTGTDILLSLTKAVLQQSPTCSAGTSIWFSTISPRYSRTSRKAS